MFLEMFVAQQDEENWKETYLTKEGKDEVISKFSDATGYELNWKNFKNHYDTLRGWYNAYKRLCKKTGVHVNSSGEIEMDREWWEDRCKVSLM